MVKLHQRKRQFRLQARDAKRRIIELDFFLVIAMRRVVAARIFERAIRQAFKDSLAIARRPSGGFILKLRYGRDRFALEKHRPRERDGRLRRFQLGGGHRQLGARQAKLGLRILAALLRHDALGR